MSVKEALYTGMIKEALNGNINVAKYLLKLDFEERKLQEHSVAQELAKLKSAIRKINKQNKYSSFPKLDPDQAEVDTEPFEITVDFVAPKPKASTQQDNQLDASANTTEQEISSTNSLSTSTTEEEPKESSELDKIEKKISDLTNQLIDITNEKESYYVGMIGHEPCVANEIDAMKVDALKEKEKKIKNELDELLEKEKRIKEEETKRLNAQKSTNTSNTNAHVPYATKYPSAESRAAQLEEWSKQATEESGNWTPASIEARG